MSKGEQAQLPLVTQRVPLLDDEPAPTRRIPLEEPDPAARVRAMAEASQRKLEEITTSGTAVEQVIIDGQLRPVPTSELGSRQGWPVNEDPNLYTNWATEGDPPLNGFWDVTDHKTGTLSARWWFDGLLWVKGDPRERGATRLTSEQFRTQYAWRGLREPGLDTYECPPYSSKDLMERAVREQVPLVTTHARLTRDPSWPLWLLQKPNEARKRIALED